MLAARAVLLKECKPLENHVLALSRRDVRAHPLHHATIDGDPVLRGKRDLLLSISDVGEALAGILLIEMPDPDMLRLRSSAKGVGA